MTLVIRTVAPRTTAAEDLMVEIPRTKLAVAPTEVPAYAETSTERARNDRHGATLDRLDHVGRQVVEVDELRFVKVRRKRGTPTDTREKIEVVQGRYERALVFGRERAVDPVQEIVGSDAHTLPSVADGGVDRRHRDRDQASDDRPPLRKQAIGKRERAAVTAEYDDTRRSLGYPLAATDSRYRWRLRGGPAEFARASARARAVSRLVRHAILASTEPRRIL